MCKSLLFFEYDVVCHVYIYTDLFLVEITYNAFKTEVMADLLFIYISDVLWLSYPLMG